MARQTKPQFSDNTYTEYCDSASCQGFQVRYEIRGTLGEFEHDLWVKSLKEVDIGEGTMLNLCEICEDSVST